MAAITKRPPELQTESAFCAQCFGVRAFSHRFSKFAGLALPRSQAICEHSASKKRRRAAALQKLRKNVRRFSFQNWTAIPPRNL
jgi:hypothetical protein